MKQHALRTVLIAGGVAAGLIFGVLGSVVFIVVPFLESAATRPGMASQSVFIVGFVIVALVYLGLTGGLSGLLAYWLGRLPSLRTEKARTLALGVGAGLGAAITSIPVIATGSLPGVTVSSLYVVLTSSTFAATAMAIGVFQRNHPTP